MGFDYDPKEASQCLDPGDYPAVIKKHEEGESKAGAPMLTIHFEVHHSHGTMTLRDYIVRPKTIFKLKRIAAALGQSKAFDDKTFDISNHYGENLILTLGVRTSPDYGDQNNIEDYDTYASAKQLQKAVSGGGPVITAEDIPFTHGAFDL